MTDLSSPQPPQGVSTAALDLLLSLARRARHASDSVELDFLAVNEAHALVPYRQAALWFEQDGVRALSGVVQKEANAPYVQWLEQLCRALQSQKQGPRQLTSLDVPEALGQEWGDWLPVHLLWLPMSSESTAGALLLMRDTPWQPIEVALLDEWRDVLQHAFEACLRSEPPSWRRRLAGLRRTWRRPRRLALLAGLVIAVGCLPIHLTVLAPGELVPANPATLRSPMDGVLGTFMVEPNQQVVKGQPLFTFDEAALNSRLEVARQALVTAEAEYRQTAQMAVYDPKAKAQLAILAGKIEERRAESDYLQGQLQRSRVVAPQDGIALFDDPSEWVGKPVTTGERIMRIALPQDVEIQAWLAVGDAIPLQAGAPVRLYLNASPLTPVAAQLRYIAHDAEQQPDGSYAYRVRATLDATTDQRVGLKGTVRLSAEQVSLAYWVLRRPLAAIRQMLGL